MQELILLALLRSDGECTSARALHAKLDTIPQASNPVELWVDDFNRLIDQGYIAFRDPDYDIRAGYYLSKLGWAEAFRLREDCPHEAFRAGFPYPRKRNRWRGTSD